MISVKVTTTWNGPKYERLLRREFNRRLDHSGRFLRDMIRDDIDTPGYDISGKGRRKKRIINQRHSRPGNPPFEQTGELWRSYVYYNHPAFLMTETGSPADYALALELGVKSIRLRPRPHARRALYGHAADLFRILAAPL
jgi:hypothetical protein